MELSLEKKFEKEKNENIIHMMDNTKEGTDQHSEKKSNFNINEIKTYLENNNYNKNDISNDYYPHLITDIDNNFSSRKEILLKESIDNEDLVMNQSYNYNPNISQNSSKIKEQNILQISQNKNENESNIISNYPEVVYHSEKKIFNPFIFPDISTKKSTKTSISLAANNNIYRSHEENKDENDDVNTCNYKEQCEDKNEDNVEDSKKNININIKERNGYEKYKEYEKNIIEKEEENYDIEIEEDTFGKYVDNIIKRSYHIYTNRQCPSCANLLSKGKSSIKCPKSHHLIKTRKN